MLVLSRLEEQDVFLTVAGKRIRVLVVEVDRGKVKLGFEAPGEVQIHRGEVQAKIDAEVERRVAELKPKP